MSLWCFPSSFSSIQLTVWRCCWRISRCGGHLGYLNGRILAILNLWISMSLRCLPSSFGSIQLTVWEEMSFEEFQNGHGGHLGYPNRTILAILNLYVAPMLPIKFRLNLTYGLGDVVWRISRWPTWWPSWIQEWNDFRNSESRCHCDASHKVFSSIRLTVWEEMPFEEFEDGRHGSHLEYRNGTISAILNLHVAQCLPLSFSSIQLIVLEERLKM